MTRSTRRKRGPRPSSSVPKVEPAPEAEEAPVVVQGAAEPGRSSAELAAAREHLVRAGNALNGIGEIKGTALGLGRAYRHLRGSLWELQAWAMAVQRALEGEGATQEKSED